MHHRVYSHAHDLPVVFSICHWLFLYSRCCPLCWLWTRDCSSIPEICELYWNRVLSSELQSWRDWCCMFTFTWFWSCLPSRWGIYSKTSNNGPSEKRTTSVQQTPHLPPIDFAIELIHFEPPRSGHLSNATPNNRHWSSPWRTLANTKLLMKMDSEATPTCT